MRAVFRRSRGAQQLLQGTARQGASAGACLPHAPKSRAARRQRGSSGRGAQHRRAYSSSPDHGKRKRSSSGTARVWPRPDRAGGCEWTLCGLPRAIAATHHRSGIRCRNACSCRYLAAPGLKDCEKDFEPGMQMFPQRRSGKGACRAVAAERPATLRAIAKIRLRPRLGIGR